MFHPRRGGANYCGMGALTDVPSVSVISQEKAPDFLTGVVSAFSQLMSLACVKLTAQSLHLSLVSRQDRWPKGPTA